MLDLDGHFGLNPNLAPLMPLWQAGKLAFVQASGSPDPTRSHFDAQDYMESGTPGRKNTPDGWLNRLLGAEPPVVLQASAGAHAGVTRGISVGATLPRIWAGPNPVANIANGARATKPTLLDRPQVSKAFDSLYSGDDAMSRAYRESQQSRAEVNEAMTPAAMAQRADGGQRRRAAAQRLSRRRGAPRAADAARPERADRLPRARRLGHPRQPGRRQGPARQPPAAAGPGPGRTRDAPRARPSTTPRSW